MKKSPSIFALIASALLPLCASAQVTINEVDADTPGIDTAEFVELYDGGTGNTSLDGLVLVLFNGNDDSSYQAYDLDGQTTDAQGFFVIGQAAVPNVDLVIGGGIQNGADAVALYTGNDTDFPNGTAATSTNLIDALVYGTGEVDTDLLATLNQTLQYDDDTNGNDDTESLSRSPDGTGDFATVTPTPSAPNNTPGVDATAPEISSLSPADEEPAAPINLILQANFNEVVVAGSGNIQLIKSSDDSIIQEFDVTSNVSFNGGAISFAPDNALETETAYHVVIPLGAIEDEAGNAFIGTQSVDDWNFITAAPDTTAPALDSLNPSPGSLFVAPMGDFTIQLNEDIIAGMGDIVIYDSADTAIETFDVATDVTFNGTSATFSPSLLVESTSYYVLIDNGAITDLSGNAFAGIAATDQWTFTTSATPTEGPDLVGLTPSPGANGVGTGLTLELQFDEEIFAGFDPANLVLRRSDDDSIVETVGNGDAAVTNSGNSLFVALSSSLEGETGYYITVEEGFGEDFDFAPSPAITGTTWSFTTLAAPEPSPLVFSQYYEGSGFNKYIELTNVSDSPINISAYTILRFNGGAAEAWKSAAQTFATSTGELDLPDVTLQPGESYLFQNSQAASPGYANSGANLVSNEVTNFNGNDSVVLYIDGNQNDSYEIEEIQDALAFTADGDEGLNTSFYRIGNGVGYNLTAGSSILDFETAVTGDGPWQQVATSVVDGTSDQTDPIALQFLPSGLPPVLDAFVIAGDVASTSLPTVSLDLTLSGGAAFEYQASEDAAFTGAVWLPASNSPLFELSSGDGEKTVFVKVRNGDGESATLSDTITLNEFIYSEGLIFTQYHEEFDNGDKYVEITNTSDSPIDMTNISIGRYSNAAAENWKITGAGQPVLISLSTAGTLAPGQTIVVANEGAVTPIDGTQVNAPNVSSPALNFNGNDSLVLFNDVDTSGTLETTEILDVLSFTDAGNEGMDVGFVRTGPGQGFSVSIGTSILNSSAIWNQIDPSLAEQATENVDNAHLGTYPGGGTAPADFAAWIANFPGVGAETGFLQDADDDGISNGLENLFDSNPSVAETSADGVGLINLQQNSATELTFQHRQNTDVASDVTASYEWSVDLVNWQASGATIGSTSVSFSSQVVQNNAFGSAADLVEVTASIAGTPQVIFVRAVATQALPPA